ncbi:MAG TPA: M23 family metallopeptidase [Actinomycetota bacterium]
MRRIALLLLLVTTLALADAGPAPAAGLWTWPVAGPILRAFDPPDDPYGSGHRGIDVGTAVGTAVVSPAAGVVTFAGKVGGQLFLTIAHGGALQSTASWLTDVLVRKGDTVAEGQVVAHTGWGHAVDPSPHLHFSVRLDGVYVDPLDYLAPMDVSALIHLAPLGAATARAPAAASGSGGAVGPLTFRMTRPWTHLVPPTSSALAAVPASWHPRWPPG